MDRSTILLLVTECANLYGHLCRCEEEDVTLTEDALNVLVEMAKEATLRYALNVISTAQVSARKRKSDKVDVPDLRRSYTYFIDAKRSVQWVKEQQGSLMFEEIETKEKDAMDES